MSLLFVYQDPFNLPKENILRKNAETAVFVTIFEHSGSNVQNVTEVPKLVNCCPKLRIPLTRDLV